MAGHSQFANIKHRKDAQDAKRSRQFTKLVRDIFIAAKSGADPESNARLKTAIATAKLYNLPKDKIEKAIAKSDTDKSGLDEVRYEGYGVGGIALVIETLTDNRNRTASTVRSIFTKHGGSLAETGAVSFMFDQVGIIGYPKEKVTEDALMETILELDGILSIEDGGSEWLVITEMQAFNNVRNHLGKVYGESAEAELRWMPQNTLQPSSDHKETLEKMIKALEDDDDIIEVYHNMSEEE